MAWTKEQEEAINHRGENIIVSAGAGSGKTAVLSERMCKFCLDGNDIRRALVVTFTRAAAKEMKERIRKKLMDNKLDLQAKLIDSAYITTFDAYSFAMVKKYYYVLNLSKDISIIDDSLVNIRLKELLDQMFIDKYNEGDLRLTTLIERYTSKDTASLKNNILGIYKKLDLELDFEELYNNYRDRYTKEVFYQYVVDNYLAYFYKNVSNITGMLSTLVYDCSEDDCNEALANACQSIIDSIASIKDYDSLIEYLATIKLPMVSRKASTLIKEEKKDVSDTINDFKKTGIRYNKLEDIRGEIEFFKDDSLFILDICKELRDKINDFKHDLMCYSFMDIARFAIDLVKNHEDIREEIKNSFDEILIDEYQDTSDSQETFISYIANNNLYMVGDIKQSIYRFRNANPYIFKNKYDNYNKGIGGYKIDLKANFRSRSEVLNNINTLFNTLMSDELGDADYKALHQMNFGLIKYNELKQDYDFNIECLSYEIEKESEFKKFSKPELEAFIIGKSIKEAMDKEIMVFDKDLNHGQFRKCEYKDFCILIDKATTFTTFKQIFDYLNIPLAIEGAVDLKASNLVKLFSNILTVINKIKQGSFDVEYNHAYASILRSFIFECSDDDIYDVFVLHNKNIGNDIFRELANESEEYVSLYFTICEKLKIHEKLSLIGNTSDSIVVLKEIYDKFVFCSSLGYSFSELANYFISLIDSSEKLTYKPIQVGKSCVRIMTIHASKGLEFPFCYFPLLSSKFNNTDEKQTSGFDKEYGIFLPYSEETTSNTAVQFLVSKSINKADLSEKVRLFYVALTRAREKLILILEKNDKKEKLGEFNSFNQMLNQCNCFEGFTKNIALEALGISFDYKKRTDLNILEGKRLNYDIARDNEIINKANISKGIYKLKDKSLRSVLEKGTYLHSILEEYDFKNDNLDSLPIDNDSKKLISKIVANPLFSSIRNGKAYKEHEFYFVNNNEEYHGIIDLLVVYNDHIDIIDYKLSNTDSVEYKKQLGIYKAYVNSIYSLRIDTYLVSLFKNEIKKIDIL